VHLKLRRSWASATTTPSLPTCAATTTSHAQSSRSAEAGFASGCARTSRDGTNSGTAADHETRSRSLVLLPPRSNPPPASPKLISDNVRSPIMACSIRAMALQLECRIRSGWRGRAAEAISSERTCRDRRSRWMFQQPEDRVRSDLQSALPASDVGSRVPSTGCHQRQEHCRFRLERGCRRDLVSRLVTKALLR
jgi:hypothetical protein